MKTLLERLKYHVTGAIERGEREAIASIPANTYTCPNESKDCTEDEQCVECCDHSDRDSHCCLICGAELGEWYAARAEYYADSMEDR